MTDLQSRAKKWLKSLITEVQTRDLPEELFPDLKMTIGEAISNLETTGVEGINLRESPLSELMEEFPTPEKMADEDLGQALSEAWMELSPVD